MIISESGTELSVQRSGKRISLAKSISDVVQAVQNLSLIPVIKKLPKLPDIALLLRAVPKKIRPPSPELVKTVRKNFSNHNTI